MIADGHFYDSGIQALGLATDSLVQTFLISGFVAFIVLAIGLGLETRRESDTRGFFSRKPVFIPGIAFIICTIIVISVGPVPMSQYYGFNEEQAWILDGESTSFRVYGGEIYSHSINLGVSYSLDSHQNLTIDIEFYRDGVLNQTSSIELVGSFADEHETVNVPLTPGLYSIAFELSGHTTGSALECTFSQPLVSGMMEEVLLWDVYKLVLLVTSIAIILIGIYVDRGSIIKKKPEYYQM